MEFVAHKSLILIIFVAIGRTRSIFRVVLLTGGLLVRIQPEEPAPNAHRINHLRIQPFWCFELPQLNSLILRR